MTTVDTTSIFPCFLPSISPRFFPFFILAACLSGPFHALFAADRATGIPIEATMVLSWSKPVDAAGAFETNDAKAVHRAAVFPPAMPVRVAAKSATTAMADEAANRRFDTTSPLLYAIGARPMPASGTITAPSLDGSATKRAGEAPLQGVPPFASVLLLGLAAFVRSPRRRR
ncbi:hypothetical protein SCOR_06375 [Sulfidibacter corallicola]|uniref:Uncharacterized protein n=1 Tax=Sulfidibacter corallicola TaxID=2818388 RepID=A0A8A4TQA2_SULCO|nr:hypothetical protein [Sulfidibacter corallicola]QTD51607.1 hypothetical protein J3U87_03980 [Sulfidibacter corallicola]